MCRLSYPQPIYLRQFDNRDGKNIQPCRRIVDLSHLFNRRKKKRRFIIEIFEAFKLSVVFEARTRSRKIKKRRKVKQKKKKQMRKTKIFTFSGRNIFKTFRNLMIGIISIWDKSNWCYFDKLLFGRNGCWPRYNCFQMIHFSHNFWIFI